MSKVETNAVRSAKTGAAAGAQAGASGQIGITPDAKQFNRLKIELQLPDNLIQKVQTAVGGLPKLNLSGDQLKNLANTAKNEKAVDAAWEQARQILDGGKTPGWAGLKQTKDPRVQMLHFEAGNLHEGLEHLHKKSPEAQLKGLQAVLNQHPYGDIDADLGPGFNFTPTPDQMANHVIDTYKLRLMTTAILAGVDPSSLGISRTE